VGVEIALSVRDYLGEGLIRNAVNFPAIPADEFPRVRPYIQLGEMLGALVGQWLRDRPDSIGIRYYGALTTQYEPIIGSAVLAGALSTFMDSGVTPVNSRALATQRGLEVVESRSSRPRDFVNVISIKLRSGTQERWVEGTVFEPGSPRVCTLEGIPVEAPLGGTLIVMRNEDRPGVIGDVGSALGRHGINIGSFALGRDERGAVSVISVDPTAALDPAVAEVRRLPAVREAVVVRL
jgi:D-3-phosphoglycerate dehydrogenase